MRKEALTGALTAIIMMAAAASAQETPPPPLVAPAAPVSDDSSAKPLFQTVGKSDDSPIGFLEMCSRAPQSCAHWPDSDLPGIQKQARATEAELFHKAFAARLAATASHDHDTGPLKVGVPNYLDHDWVTLRSRDDSAYLWPSPAAEAQIRDDLSVAGAQFAFDPVNIVFVPRASKTPSVGKIGIRDHFFLNWTPTAGVTGWGSMFVPELKVSQLTRAPTQEALHRMVDLVLNPRWDDTQTLPTGDTATVTPPATGATTDTPSPTEALPVYRQVMLTPTQFQIMRRINDLVNHSIWPETDMAHYGVEDYWVAPGIGPGISGDCEDYALEKRELLLQEGFPAAAMSLATADLPSEKMHVVLIVSTTEGDYVLDNLAGTKIWHKAHYKWLERQGPEDDLKWFSLQSQSTQPTAQ